MGFMNAPSADGGNFKIFVSFNAKAGRWYTREDKPDADLYEVTNMTAIFDMDNLKTGWFLFAAGVAPVKQFDPSLSQAAQKPGDGFKRGFELDVFSEKNLGGVREFASTAGVAIEAMNDLYDAWMAAPEKASGKLPVVKCSGVVAVTGKHGTNYRPTLEIVSWADRPTELANSAASPAPVQSEPKKQGAKHAEPPVPVSADEVDF